MILSTAMMLEWLGYEAAARAIVRAVEEAYKRGYTTPDVGGGYTTTRMAERIAGMVV